MVFLLLLSMTIGLCWLLFNEAKNSSQYKDSVKTSMFIGVLILMFGSATYFSYPTESKRQEEALKEKQEKLYEYTYNSCKEKYSENDTMRNTALLVVQLQFKKIDKLSLAPTEPREAIKILCEVQAEEAKNKLNIENK